MDEHRFDILKQSSTEISRLQLLSVFFEEEIIYKIFLRSQVIHQLFEQNEELDIDKLELFHVQFSSSVIELLRKIKKSNEKNVSLVYDEISLNKELIQKMKNSISLDTTYNLDKQRHSLKINQSLRKLFQVLSDHTSEFPFAKNLNSFSSRFSRDFYFDISTEQLGKLIDYDSTKVYVNAFATIERKLMGLLCKYDFKTSFFYGLKSGQLVVEIYKFLEVDKYFLFFPSRNLFLFCDLNDLEGVDWTNNLSEKENLILEIAYKTDQLESNAATLKTYIPKEILSLLEENYLKISDMNFLDHLQNFDVQANILKAMLKTDLF
jgi:hypothetical protein